MQKQIAFPIVFVILLLAASPATKRADDPGRSSDGVEYGEVAGDLKPVRLPHGVVLGGPPSLLVGAKPVWTRTRSKDEVGKLLGPCEGVAAGTGGSLPQFYANGTASDALGFDVIEGRVVRVVLYFKNGSETKSKSMADEFRRAGEKANPKIKSQALGSPSYAQSQISNGKGSGPSGLAVFFQPVDFYLTLHPDTSDEIADAMRSGKLKVGMTEAQANATMWMYERVESASTEHAKLVTWRQWVGHLSSRVGAPTNWTQQDVASATIENAKITEVTNNR